MINMCSFHILSHCWALFEMVLHVLPPASPILGKKNMIKNMGRYKIDALAHDSMQPYKLELVSDNTSCPHYKMTFSAGCFFKRKQEPAKDYFEVQAPWYTKRLFEYPLILGYQI